MAKLKLLRISGSLLMEIFAEGAHPEYSVLVNGIPSGTEVLGAHMLEHSVVELLLQHDSFEDIAEGQPVPQMESPVFRK